MRPYKMRIPRKCTPQCYLKRVLPALLKKHVSCWPFGLLGTLILERSRSPHHSALYVLYEILLIFLSSTTCQHIKLR